jgi:UTP--glucose-1-phosphate uridylyltransferase
MPKISKDFDQLFEKMMQAALPEISIKNFRSHFDQLIRGETGHIPESAILPVDTLVDAETLEDRFQEIGEAQLSRSVFLKLNGGLGTSMGLEQAKSLLVVQKNYTFLDIITQQAIQSGFRLLLMNSFSTHQDSLEYLKKYSELEGNISLDFLQHKVPKVRQEDLSPVEWPQNPSLEWCPPGHGDVYISLYSSGILEQLLNSGYQFGFISNADNLGAVLDSRILGYFIEKKFPFMMEVTDRTEADKKGGHLAKLPHGQLILREIAQCPEEDQAAFQDINRHRFFNTNNLWIDLKALLELLKQKDFILDLPMILNQKTVDPRQPESIPVVQIETAAGSAISLFKNSAAIRIPRTRFAPVKNTNDLLAVRSDRYVVTEDYRISPIPTQKQKAIEIDLDSQYYKLIDDFELRFPHGAPSLKNCTKLQVRGNVKFGKQVKLYGNVEIVNESDDQVTIPDDSKIEGRVSYNT